MLSPVRVAQPARRIDEPPPARRGRPPIVHDNRAVQRFLGHYYRVGELCEDYWRAEDIFTGVVHLRSPGDGSTRTLSRQTVFHVLQWCPTIDLASVKRVTGGRLGDRATAQYAAAARVASKALADLFAGMRGGPRRESVRDARDRLDGPHHAELRALGLM